MDNTLVIQPVKHNDFIEVITPETELELLSTDKPFIQANTISSTLSEIKKEHLIPVYAKDNEPLISGADFIEAMSDIVTEVYRNETVLKPNIRLSHPIKGRVPGAKDKAAASLEEWEKTIYYERMAFIIEIPTISDVVDGNRLSLTVGGIKAYNLDNLYNRKGADEHFKIWIGFQNKVCLNMCVWSDGAMMDLKVTSRGQLMACIRSLIQNYNQNHHLYHLKELCNYSLTEQKFAQLIGRTRMYPYLPNTMKKEITQLLFGDTQMGAVVKDYYRDDSFAKMNETGWRVGSAPCTPRR